MVKSDLVKAQYEVLGHEEGKDYTELRCLPSGKSYFSKSVAELQLNASSADGNLYVGINPRNKQEGKASNIHRLTCLVVDIDPVRPKDTPSTDEQHKSALELGTRIQQDFGGGVVVSSGSGCHIYFPIQPIEVKNATELSKSLKTWMDGIKDIYATNELKIDSIWDLPRVIRLWGSVNLRSNRPCEVISGLEGFSRFSWTFNQEPKEAKSPSVVVETTQTEERFSRLVSVNPKLKGLVDGTISLPSPSEYDFAFVSTLAKAHFTVDEIKSLYRFNTHGNKTPKKGDVERIVGKTVSETTGNSFSLVHSNSSYFNNLSTRKMGHRSGFERLDEMLSGFKEGKMYIFAARPNQGKTTIGMQIVTALAEQGLPSLVFPTEVGAEPLVDKIISRKTKINLKKFQNGSFTENDLELIKTTRDYVSSLPITIIEDFGLTIDKIYAETAKFAPKVLMLDYFQCLRWNDPSSVGEKEKAVQDLKKLIKDNNLIGIVMSQLKRSDNSGKASLSELKGTGALEELGDVVGQMYRIDNIGQYPVQVDLTITKSKYSATGNVPLKFWSSECRFEEDTDGTRDVKKPQIPR